MKIKIYDNKNRYLYKTGSKTVLIQHTTTKVNYLKTKGAFGCIAFII